MYAVIRTYSGAGALKLFDILEKRKSDVESLLKGVRGLKSYTLMRSGDGGLSVTVCEDKAGTDESIKRAREWILENASGTGVSPPVVTEGLVLVQIN